MTHAYGLDMFNEGRKRDKGLVFYSKRVTKASLVCRDSVTEKAGPSMIAGDQYLSRRGHEDCHQHPQSRDLFDSVAAAIGTPG